MSKIWLLLTVFVSGGVVMLLEVLGARALSPFFGVGLFSWSALIAVTLSALAIGYFVGGTLAPRVAERSTRYYGAVVVAGILVALIPLSLRPVLCMVGSLELRLGALLSASILFGPSMLVLGILSPLSVQLAARQGVAAGNAAGRVFGISTAGGLAATLLTGFVLVSAVPLSTIFLGAAMGLLAVGAGGLVVSGRSIVAMLLVLLPLSASGQAPKDEPIKGVRILARSSSLFGDLAVVEDSNRGAPLRLLKANRSFIGAKWTTQNEPAFGFVHVLEAVRLANPSGKHLLLIGLGIGSLVEELRDDGIISDVVEIDPEVVRLAREYFDFQTDGNVYIQDARTFVRHTNSKYDYIVHDTFTGGSTPEHMLSVELIRELKALLRPQGVLALNLVGSHQGTLAASPEAVLATIRAVFPHVRVFRDQPPGRHPEQLSNVMFFASTQPIVFADPSMMNFNGVACERTLRHFEAWDVTDLLAPSGPVVTDDYNPLSRLALPVTERFRESMNELYPLEFWLN